LIASEKELEMNALTDIDFEARKEAIARETHRRLLQHIREGTNDLSSDVMYRDPEIYTSEERARLEREEVFLKLPLVACLSNDIPEPGDKILFEHTGPSIVVVRARDGSVKAFLNMCRHRASKVVTECTRSSRMTCRFHGWTYDTDGRLIGLPGAEGFAGLDKADLGLIPVPVLEWHGLVFVQARAGSEPLDIDAFLGDFAPELAQIGWDKLLPVRTSRYTIGSNWKFALDTYSEGYHFAPLHPTTIGLVGITDLAVYFPFGAHHRISFAATAMKKYAHAPEEEWPHMPFQAVNHLFPNMNFTVSPMENGKIMYTVFRVYPGETPDQSFTIQTCYRGPDSEGMPVEDWIEYDKFVENVVSTEDYAISEEGQVNLRYAPAGHRTILGRNEPAPQDWHRHMDKLIAEAQSRRAGKQVEGELKSIRSTRG
jgi:carnitine monooxygenase subunit